MPKRFNLSAIENVMNYPLLSEEDMAMLNSSNISYMPDPNYEYQKEYKAEDGSPFGNYLRPIIKHNIFDKTSGSGYGYEMNTEGLNNKILENTPYLYGKIDADFMPYGRSQPSEGIIDQIGQWLNMLQGTQRDVPKYIPVKSEYMDEMPQSSGGSYPVMGIEYPEGRDNAWMKNPRYFGD